MLCQPHSLTMLPYEHGSPGEASRTASVTSSSAPSCSNNARAASPSSSSTPAAAGSTSAASAPQPPRQRHHLRSFSTEKRFGEAHDDVPSDARNGLSTTTQPVRPSLHSASSSVDARSTPFSPAMFSAPPTRSRRSPSFDSLTAASSLQTTSAALLSPPSASSASPAKSAASPSGSHNSSPLKASHVQGPAQPASSPTAEGGGATSADEREQVDKLRQAQANRRPRVLRLTPAFSSLPTHISTLATLSSDDLNAKSTEIPASREKTTESTEAPASNKKTAKSTPPADSVSFPSKNSDATGRPSASNSIAPSAGLQIDLACIPSPSLADLQGPISSSQVETMVRDRHGNPIKPSLKSSRSGTVSHFLPGRTTRSDSTPSLPAAISSKSVPTTPTLPKNVKFDTHLEHVKLFKNRQRPTAVSRDGSPEQTETETEEEKEMFPYIWQKGFSSGHGATSAHQMSPPTIRAKSPTPVEEQLILRLPNFPSSTRLSTDRPVFLERIFLADDLRSVKGTVQVRNMSFEKWVAVRYTLDHWATIGEVSAEFSDSIKGGQADRFSFSIKLNELLNWPRGSAAHETKSMFMCIRYTCNSTEHWDNNESHNYQLDFRRRPMPATPTSTPSASAKAPPRANVPASVATVAPTNSSKTRVLEMARHGVGGKGVFAMDDLRRELEKLRSDDEEDAGSRIQTLAAEVRARHRAVAAVSQSSSVSSSPPRSPDARSASPSMWSARYDFGRSLRDSGKGSRNTDGGRAAALDYFSARPPLHSHGSSPGNHDSNTPQQTDPVKRDASTSTGKRATLGTSSESPLLNRSELIATAPADSALASTAPSLSISAASPQMQSTDFADGTAFRGLRGSFNAHFGMFSPGLDDETVKHMPTRGSRTPSTNNTPSPGATPTLGASALPTTSASSSASGSPDRFHSYPPNRHTYFPAYADTLSGEVVRRRLSSGLSSTTSSGRSSPSHESLSTIGAMLNGSASDASPGRRHDAPVDGSDNSSPPSEMGSPNPFSPSVSVSSIESDTTISNGGAPMSGDDNFSAPLKTPAFSNMRTRSPSNPGASVPALGRRRTDTAADEDLRLRPASMSDYNELVSRFCWNSDLVPSGGPMVPDVPKGGGYGKPSMFTDGRPAISSPLAEKTSFTGVSTPSVGGSLPPAAQQESPPFGNGSNSGSGSGASTPTLT